MTSWRAAPPSSGYGGEPFFFSPPLRPSSALAHPLELLALGEPATTPHKQPRPASRVSARERPRSCNPLDRDELANPNFETISDPCKRSKSATDATMYRPSQGRSGSPSSTLLFGRTSPSSQAGLMLFRQRRLDATAFAVPNAPPPVTPVPHVPPPPAGSAILTLPERPDRGTETAVRVDPSRPRPRFFQHVDEPAFGFGHQRLSRRLALAGFALAHGLREPPLTNPHTPTHPDLVFPIEDASDSESESEDECCRLGAIGRAAVCAPRPLDER